MLGLLLLGMLDSQPTISAISSQPWSFMNMEAQLGLLNSLSPQSRTGESALPVHASPSAANRFMRLSNPDGLVSQPLHSSLPFQQPRTKVDPSDASWSSGLPQHNSVSDPADLITALNTMAAQQHAILISNFNSKLQSSEPVPPMPDVRSNSMLSSTGVFHHNSSQMRFPDHTLPLDVPPPPHSGLAASFNCPPSMLAGDSRASASNGRFGHSGDYPMRQSECRTLQHPGNPQLSGNQHPRAGGGMADIDHQGAGSVPFHAYHFGSLSPQKFVVDSTLDRL